MVAVAVKFEDNRRDTNGSRLLPPDESIIDGGTEHVACDSEPRHTTSTRNNNPRSTICGSPSSQTVVVS